MRRMVIGIVLTVAAVIGGAACGVSDSASQRQASASSEQNSAARQHASHDTTTKRAPGSPEAHPAPDAAGHEGHGHGAPATGEFADPYRVPAFEVSAASLNSLAPTLSPEKFDGKQRLAYQAVKEIPKTIAQLPCYCYCDQGFGHKSLHSCFVDDHAAHCGVCVDEALLALKLQKEDGLKPEQVRARIVETYGPKRSQAMN